MYNSAMFVSVFHLVNVRLKFMKLCHIQEPSRWLLWDLFAFLIWTSERQMELISSSCGAPFSRAGVLLDLSFITEVRKQRFEFWNLRPHSNPTLCYLSQMVRLVFLSMVLVFFNYKMIMPKRSSNACHSCSHRYNQKFHVR